ncbi:MAG: NADPH:quinone oxidoreductase family protein [Variibacter sp.]|nr:NADPH:quinone oxidoreductase family protein [Variibacter sp.]
MKAVLCTQYGPLDALALADVPEPAAGPGEAVVAVKAVGLNFFDTLLVAGQYQVKPELPFSPGAEFAGVVESVAAGVTAVKPGDRVMGYANYGAARERIAVSADTLIPMPAGLDFDRAAGLLVTYGTSYYALKDRAGLQPGETLAVLGAAGGVGLAAVELGKLMGARVIACASSDDKLAFARRHGADETVNYTNANLRDALRARTQGRGVDVVFDPVGGSFTEAAVRALNWGGRLLVVGFAAGEIPRLPLNLTLLKSCDVRGVFWGAWTRREPSAHRANTQALAAWCAQGRLSVHVHAALPLAEAVRALHLLADRQAMGKVVLRP